jgi:hypothetical protein
MKSKNKIANFRGKRGVNGLDKNPQNINRNGRKLGMKAQLLNELNSNGTMKIKKSNIVETKPNGDIVVQTTTAHTLVTRLMKLANGKNPTQALNAIKLIMDKTDDVLSPINIETESNSFIARYSIDVRKLNGQTLKEFVWYFENERNYAQISYESLLDFISNIELENNY